MTLKDITERILAFRNARDWKQFHTPKDMLLALNIEVSELQELFLWKSEAEIQAMIEKDREEIGAELADILYWVLLLANECGIDLGAASARKMALNEAKYPVEKAKGSHAKYTKLDN